MTLQECRNIWQGSHRLFLRGRELKRAEGSRVQKISITLERACPKQRGGGCAFCNPDSFLPPDSRGQLDPVEQFYAGMEKFREKYPEQKYIAYVQGYTGTLGQPLHLEQMYAALLELPEVHSLVIGTRPDCLPSEILDALARLSRQRWPSIPSGESESKKYVAEPKKCESKPKTKDIRVELGVESFSPSALREARRGVSPAQIRSALRDLEIRNIPAGAHIIIGLPGEDQLHMLPEYINHLPLSMLKFHQLQLIRKSPWGELAASGKKISSLPRKSLTVQDYADTLLDVIERIRPDIQIERLCADAAEQLVIHEHESWKGMKNYRFTAMFEAELEQRNTWQGRKYEP